MEILKSLEEDFKKYHNHEIYIFKNFAFEIHKTIKCTECNSSRSHIYPSYSLPLMIFKSSNLNECLKSFFMSQNGIQTCKNCNRKTLTEFTEKILSLPKVCIFQLQRMGMNLKKNNELVDFPIENLNLSEFLLSKKQAENYDLIAVSNHIGSSVRNGHYTSFVKFFLFEQDWYSLDDRNVVKLNKNEIKSPNNYILFYEQKF